MHVIITIPGRRFGRATARDAVSLAALYRDLTERMLAAAAEVNARTADHAPVRMRVRGATLDRLTSDSSEPGHPFHGNQYVKVQGAPKPTEVKATSAFAGMHELLSSGHPFTKAELMAIAKVPTEKKFGDYIAMLKNPKYAGSKGALAIKKLEDGTFMVVTSEGLPAPALAETKAEPKAIGPAVKIPGPAKAPPAPAAPTKAEVKALADKDYAASIAGAQADLEKAVNAYEDYPVNSPQMLESVQQFKIAKAKAMAEWATKVTGNPTKPKVQQIFEADKQLLKDLKGGKPAGAAFGDWKTNTQAEKMGLFGVKAKLPEMAKAEKKTITLAEVKKKVEAKAYADLHPDGFEPIGPEDLSGKLKKGMTELKSWLMVTSGSAQANKQGVNEILVERLKDKPNFQAIKQALGGAESGIGSLESKLISTWASSSGDGNPMSVALQIAVRDAFSMPADKISTKSLHALALGDEGVNTAAAAQLGIEIKAPGQMETFREGLKEFVHAQYDATQDLLKKSGLDHVYVARGMKIPDPIKGPDAAPIVLQPASSFSANLSTAKSFGGGNGTVFFAKVPREQVLSTYVSGFGCTNEHEVVVLSHERLKAYSAPVDKAGGALIAVAHIKSKGAA